MKYYVRMILLLTKEAASNYMEIEKNVFFK